MLKNFLLLMTFSFTAFAIEEPSDPYLWLEDVESPRALEWVKKENTRTLSDLESQPCHAELHKEASDILLADNRIPVVRYREGALYNFWQDKTNLRGLWRRTSVEEYKKENPKWETLLDLDALSKKEGKTWVWKGGYKLGDSNRYILSLSDGGTDAAFFREYDIEKKEFIENGFSVPEAKTQGASVDENTVLIATDFGPGSQTTSGYPRILKLWKRGEPLSQAKTIFEINRDDMVVSAETYEYPDRNYTLVQRVVSFFKAEQYLFESGELKRLPVPDTAEIKGFLNGLAIVLLREDLETANGKIEKGSVVSISVHATAPTEAKVLFSPNLKMAVNSVVVGKKSVFISLLENVRGRILQIEKTENGWTSPSVVPFPSGGAIDIASVDPFEGVLIVSYQDFLTPLSYHAYSETDKTRSYDGKLREAPSVFDSSHFETKQFFAKSRDGTEIPYSVIQAKGVAYNGQNPTVLWGYGGFEISETPTYLDVTGKLWLERGGVYVIANIRGGGEFGPRWHQAALKENRQRAYDDFIGIAEDLITRGITTPRHLAIKGGSNGGLLVGAVTMQRPDLFNAVICGVPLLDMHRYHRLLAGASWMEEYGNPDDPKDWEYISKYSPYQNLRADKRYPEIFFVTSTKDDRVHPGHARKMAARMQEYGHSFSYFENVDGGHAAGTDPKARAARIALEFSFLWKKLK